VAQPPEQSTRPPAASGGRGGGYPVARAVIVLAGFVITTVLVLGVIHPTPSTSGTAAGSSAATTTQPPHETTTTTTAPPSHVPVLVANASGVSGAAGVVTTELQTAGWTVLPPVNASARVTTSNVYYVAGQQRAAQSLATSLHLPASAVVAYTTSAPVSSISTAELLVVVGPDLANPPAGTATTVN
jgi:hypothetical protein